MPLVNEKLESEAIRIEIAELNKKLDIAKDDAERRAIEAQIANLEDAMRSMMDRQAENYNSKIDKEKYNLEINEKNY